MIWILTLQVETVLLKGDQLNLKNILEEAFLSIIHFNVQVSENLLTGCDCAAFPVCVGATLL